MEFGEMKRNTANWSNFCMLPRRAGLSASAGLSCLIMLQYCVVVVLVCNVCNVAKRCVLEQKLLLTAYKKS